MRQRIQALALTLVLIGSVVAVAPATATADAQEQSASVTFEAQTSGGHTVTIDEVTLPDGGFVTIHDGSLQDGHALSSVVGTSVYLEEGTHENVTIRLDEPVSEDATLIAMPHKDTNDNQIYEFVSANAKADGPYTADGGAVVDPADVTVSASVTMDDQPTDGTTVVVDRVELSQPGFVTIHDGTVLDGAVFDSVVGHSEKLSAGVHENVRIELDVSVESGTFVAMPHKDTNEDGEYTFVESEGANDGPFVTMDEKAVVDAGALTLDDTASVSATAQSTGGNAVVVDSVFVPNGGFVTIHDGSVADGEVFESIRGTSTYLEPGLHENVRVSLDASYESDGTIVAMAHKDTDGDQQYTFAESEGANDGPYTADGSAVTASASATVSASVSMDVQSSNGQTVVVDSVDLSEPGFVTIHDSSLFAGEVFGSVAGTSMYLEAGHHENVKVMLDEPVTETQTLVAMAHKDTDGDQQYTFVESEGSNDGPFVYDGGAVVSPAKVSVNAVTQLSDQQSDGDTVVVDSVTLANGGFVTIHDATLADGEVFGSVRGTSEYLGPGTHENVEITLDSELSGETTVFAMAHKDTDGDESYSFVESEGAADGPYVAASAPVMTQASIDAPEMTTTTQTTPTETTKATTTEATTMADETTEEATGGSPGFGLAAALVAALGAALLAFRRQ